MRQPAGSSMNKSTVLFVAFCVIAAGIMAAVTARAASGDERFLGGWYDGYDRSDFEQAGTNAIASAAGRFKGGFYDGYDSTFKTGTRIKDGISFKGILMIMR